MVRYHKNPKAQRINNCVAHVTARLAAPVFLLIGVFQAYDRIETLVTFDKTIGTIVDAEYRDPGYSRSGTTLVSSKVRFKTADGRWVLIESAYSTTKSDEIGRTVAIRYDPTNPESAVIMDFWDFWILPPLMFFCSTVLWILGTHAKNFVPPGMHPKDLIGPSNHSADGNG